MNGYDRIIRWSEELGVRGKHRWLWIWLLIMCDRCHSKYGRYCEIVICLLLTLRVQQNSFVIVLWTGSTWLFSCSRNLFQDFGYDKLKSVLAIIWPYTWHMKLRFGAYIWYCVSEYQRTPFSSSVLEHNWKHVRWRIPVSPFALDSMAFNNKRVWSGWHRAP